MPDTVPVTLELDPATLARVERLIIRVTGAGGFERLFATMDALQDEAHRRGLTDAIVDEELGTYNAERTTGRDALARVPAVSDDVVARFQAFAAGHTLGGVDLKELISEGRR